jgi:predicted dehydrogenase
MSEPLCRWGILSTANIARKNWKAIRLSGNGTVSGVSSRSAERAAQFIAECQAETPFPETPQAFADHDALLASDQIDAVYVPLPTGLRKEWVIKAAEAKKHVLIEKPVADTAADAKEMIDACQSNGVQLMDGVMFDHSKRIADVRKQIEGGELGKVHRVQAHFSFASDDEFRESNIRTDPVLERHGCLGDLGWYCIRFILWTQGFSDPTHVRARILTAFTRPGATDSVPGELTGELEFGDGVTAGFYCSFLTHNQQTAYVSGDRGYLSLDDYVLPLYDSKTNWQIHRHDLVIDNCRWNFARRTEHFHCDEYHSGESEAQEVAMVRNFANLVASGQTDATYANRALQTQRVLDACLRSDAENGARISFADVK